jgi:DNA helicase II / ATP-dependent DNA helicase PcrA
MRSRFVEEIPAELIEEPATPFGGGAFRPGAGSLTSWSSQQPEPASSERAFRLGEDIVHAAFGDGVVTAVEPGGVIVVRFAGDGSERKLMAEYAPVSRR